MPNGITSSLWGPGTWFLLHSIGATFPDDVDPCTRSAYRQWFELLQYVLPCNKCRDNLPASLSTIGYDSEDDFMDRESFTNMLWRLHNEVRAKLEKPITFKTFDQYQHFYEQFRATGSGIPLSCTLFIGKDTDHCRFIIDKATI